MSFYIVIYIVYGIGGNELQDKALYVQYIFF